jgi:hypothetical protein
MYYIQNNHLGRSSLFLKNPENSITGIITIGTTLETDLASNITLPNKRPKLLPAKPIKNKVKKKVKNCPPVFARPTIQYRINADINGTITS